MQQPQRRLSSPAFVSFFGIHQSFKANALPHFHNAPNKPQVRSGSKYQKLLGQEQPINRSPISYQLRSVTRRYNHKNGKDNARLALWFDPT
jgi:hypothetical protein